MRNLFLCIAVIAIIGLVSCNKDEIENLKKDVSYLQDSLNTALSQQNALQDSLNSALDQHNTLLDSVSALIETIDNIDNVDVSALKIYQITYLFDAIARQPEAYKTLISATEGLYFDYTELMPFSDMTIENRGGCLGNMFDGIARQPEAFNYLDSAATKFLGEFNPSYMSSDFTEGKARGIAICGLFAGIARQPEAYGKFDSVATKFLGAYSPSYFSNELLEITKAYSIRCIKRSLSKTTRG